MNTMNLRQSWHRTSAWARGLSLAVLAAGAWAASTAASNAHARGDVYWSIGVNSPGGVAVGVSNAPPVVVYPRPVIVQPVPVVVHRPYPYVRPVVVVPQPVYGPGWGPRPRWEHRGHPRWDRHDRYDRRDRYDRYERHERRGRGDRGWDD